MSVVEITEWNMGDVSDGIERRWQIGVWKIRDIGVWGGESGNYWEIREMGVRGDRLEYGRSEI